MYQDQVETNLKQPKRTAGNSQFSLLYILRERHATLKEEPRGPCEAAKRTAGNMEKFKRTDLQCVITIKTEYQLKTTAIFVENRQTHFHNHDGVAMTIKKETLTLSSCCVCLPGDHLTLSWPSFLLRTRNILFFCCLIKRSFFKTIAQHNKKTG